MEQSSRDQFKMPSIRTQGAKKQKIQEKYLMSETEKYV
jgi:hypothetical protein